MRSEKGAGVAPPQKISSLDAAQWLKAAGLQNVLHLLADAGFEGRVVGGAVRNALMGLPVKDVDVATTALPQNVVGLARAAGLNVVETGIAHGTVTVISDHQPYEVTTLRKDVETHGRHARWHSPTIGRPMRRGAISRSTRSTARPAGSCTIRSGDIQMCWRGTCASSAIQSRESVRTTSGPFASSASPRSIQS